MVVVFFIGILCMMILSVRCLFLCLFLKNELNYQGSTMSLYYMIINASLGQSDLMDIKLSTDRAKQIYSKCSVCVRFMAAIVIVESVFILVFD